MKIGIIETKDFSDKAKKELSKIGEVKMYGGGSLRDFLSDKDAIFVRLAYYWGKENLSSAKQLKYICSPTTGLNHIDGDFIAEKGIKILSLKGERRFLNNIRATPEFTFGLIIALLRNFKTCFLNERNNNRDREKYVGSEIYGTNIGIIGFGRVGSLLAKFLKSFGANIYFFDTNDNLRSKYGAKKVTSIEKLIKISNIIILSASYSDENKKFFGKKYIDLLKGKYFINTARGELVDEKYLIKKIRMNHFSGIAIDVICNENDDSKNNFKKMLKLTKNKNFIITPHLAGATYESMRKTEEFIAEKLIKEIKKWE